MNHICDLKFSSSRTKKSKKKKKDEINFYNVFYLPYVYLCNIKHIISTFNQYTKIINEIFYILFFSL